MGLPNARRSFAWATAISSAAWSEVAYARLVVSEEDLPHQVAPAAHTGLVEHALEVLLDGVSGDDQALGNLHRRVALEDQLRHILLALRQPVSRHEERRYARGVRRFHDHGDASGTAGDETDTMEHDPHARARQHTRHGDLTGLVRVFRRPARPTRDRENRGRQLACAPVAVGQV